MLAQGRDLGHHHFAFLRAWFQGIEVQQAWDRYLSFAFDSSDARVIERTRAALLDAVLAAGHQADRSHPHLGLKRELDLIARDRYGPTSAPIPSLADWISSENIDPDFSEAELLEMYREHYALDNVAEHPGSPRDVNEQVRALNVIADVLAKAPSANDRLALWLEPKVAAALQAVGLRTLGDLAASVARSPKRWHAEVRGLGERRAQVIAAWLGGLDPITLSDRAVASEIPGASWLQSSEAMERDDRAAVEAWLASLQVGGHTSRAYRKEIERLLLWSVRVCRKPLSGLDEADGRAYVAFLADVPAAWIQPLPVARDHPAWRPFRCPLSASSQRQAIAVLRRCLRGLVEAGLLRIDPLRSVRPADARVVVGEGSSPSSALCCTIRSDLATPIQRRRALLRQLVCSTDLTLPELTRLRRNALVRQAGGHWQLQARSRGGARSFPVPDDWVDLLNDHHADMRAAGQLVDEHAPLVWAMGGGARSQRTVRAGVSAAGVHQCLKRWRLPADRTETARYHRFSIRQLRSRSGVASMAVGAASPE